MKTYLLVLVAFQLGLAACLAQVSEKQKDDFLSRFKAAVAANSADEYLKLEYTEKVPADLVEMVKTMAAGTVKLLNPKLDTSKFSWEEVTPEAVKSLEFSQNGVTYRPNIEPAMALNIIFPASASKADGLDSMSFTLGLHEDRLYIVCPVPKE